MLRIPHAALVVLVFALMVAVGPGARVAAARDDAPVSKAADAEKGGSGHAKAEAEPNLLQLKPPLAVATLIVFGLLLAVLGRFAWKPLLQALHDREHSLEETLLQTEQARDQAVQLVAEHQKTLDKAADEVRAMLDEARKQSQTLKDDMIRQAQQEAESARKRAEMEIGAARDQALMELWNRSADLAVAVAGKVLPRELNAQDHRRLVDQAIQDLPVAQAGAGNGRGGRS